MIQTYNVARASGKSTKVREMLDNDSQLYCIVPTYNYKSNFTLDQERRVIVVGMDIEKAFRGRVIKKVVLDEGFAYQKDTLAKLYYYLGLNGIDVVAFGTIE